MNIFSRIKSAKNALFGQVVAASLPSGVMEWMARMGKEPDVSHTALVRKYWGWVYACALLSATRFASTPLKVYASRAKGQSKVKHFAAHPVDKHKAKYLRERVGKGLEHVGGAEDFEELEEHPLMELMQKVNDQENGYEVKELTQTMLDLTGNGYWMLERDKLGVPSKIFVLRSQWVIVQPDKKNFVSGYIYGCDGNRFGQDQLVIPPEQVIHFKYPNPFDVWYGLGPVQAAAYAIESQELREKFVLATMGNMARPDLIVKYIEGELDPRDRAMLEREWNSMFKGVKNAGKVKVTDFRYEIDKVGWNPSELKFNEGEEWILRKICAAFPVPEGLIDSSTISKAPRAGMEGTELFMAQNNTLPRCTRFEEKLNERLCPMYDDRLFVAFDNPVPKDRVTQLNEDDKRLTQGVITINEVRVREGLDEVEWGDKPLQIQQQEAAAEQAEKDRQAGAQQFDEDGNPLPPLDDAAGSEDGAGGREPESNDQADDDSTNGATGRAGGGSPFKKKPFGKKGGAGSGNFGHSGRPGEVGGSSDEDIPSYRVGAIRAVADGMFVDYFGADGSKTGTHKIGNAAEAAREAEVFNVSHLPLDTSLPFIAKVRTSSFSGSALRNMRVREAQTNRERMNTNVNRARWIEGEGLHSIDFTYPVKEEDRIFVEVTSDGKIRRLKSFDNSMTVEVDGQYVAPQLAGIPLRLKPRRPVRNERGEFDLLDPDRIRATRETVEALR